MAITTRNDARTELAQTHHWADLDEEQREALTDWLWRGTGRELFAAIERARRDDDHYERMAANEAYELALLAEVDALQIGECAYCGRDVDVGATVPAADDDAAWTALATLHRQDCEWVGGPRGSGVVWPSDLVIYESPDGWSLHAPGSTDEQIANGDAPYLISGEGTPTAADYEAAIQELRRRAQGVSPR